MYLITSGVIFGLIPLLHVWKAIAEGSQTARDPAFILTTVMAAGMCFWAFWLVGRSPRVS